MAKKPLTFKTQAELLDYVFDRIEKTEIYLKTQRELVAKKAANPTTFDRLQKLFSDGPEKVGRRLAYLENVKQRLEQNPNVPGYYKKYRHLTNTIARLKTRRDKLKNSKYAAEDKYRRTIVNKLQAELMATVFRCGELLEKNATDADVNTNIMGLRAFARAKIINERIAYLCNTLRKGRDLPKTHLQIFEKNTFEALKAIEPQKFKEKQAPKHPLLLDESNESQSRSTEKRVLGIARSQKKSDIKPTPLVTNPTRLKSFGNALLTVAKIPFHFVYQIVQDIKKSFQYNDLNRTLKVAATLLFMCVSVSGGFYGGAITGAILGSIVPGIGTAIGAIIGGAVCALLAANFTSLITKKLYGFYQKSIHLTSDKYQIQYSTADTNPLLYQLNRRDSAQVMMLLLREIKHDSTTDKSYYPWLDDKILEVKKLACKSEVIKPTPLEKDGEDLLYKLTAGAHLLFFQDKNVQNYDPSSDERNEQGLHFPPHLVISEDQFSVAQFEP